MQTTITIRTATPKDAERIAFVHIHSWQTTYRGIIADDFLDKLDVGARSQYWHNILTQRCDNVFVADHNGVVVGFASAGKNREDNSFDSELYAIYVMQQYQYNNIGRLLLKAAATYLQTCGYMSMSVWMLADNNSKRFYERLGGKQFDGKEIDIGEQKLIEVAYGWEDVSALVTTSY